MASNGNIKIELSVDCDSVIKFIRKVEADAYQNLFDNSELMSILNINNISNDELE